ncbi:ABC transporter ATP-binding protein [Amycolatopsis sp. NPDC005003]
MKGMMPGILRVLAISWGVSKRKTLTAIALAMSATAAGPLLAFSLGKLTDAVVHGRSLEAATYGGLAAIFAIMTLSCSNFASVAEHELAELAEQAFVERLMGVSNGSVGIEHHERPDYADMVTVLDPESRRFPNALQSLFSMFGLALAVTFTAVLLAGLNPVLLLLPIAAVPPLFTGRWAERITDRSRSATAEPTRIARNLFRLSSSARFAGEVRVFRLSDQLRRRHATLWDRTSRHLWRANTRAALVRAAGQVVFGLAYVGAVILVVREAIAGQHSVGDVVLVISLATQVNQQVATAVVLLADLQRMANALQRLDTMGEIVREGVPAAPDLVPPARLTGGIELEDVDFTYPGSDARVLQGLSLSLPAGSTVAIVGENGAGKTTLVKLLCGLYRPSGGRILVDGAELDRIPMAAWRERIAAGFQDFVRYEFTAGQTVGVGDLPRLDDEDAIRTALSRAQATDVVDQLPRGLDTELGTSYGEGTELSGGQWQKLALGRALMRDTPLLLVLDEPTSALDAEAEHRLFEQYGARAKQVAESTGAITLFVSHRFSTVRMADLILVVQDGHIAERGDHDALMRAGGIYAELFDLQARAYK